MHASRLKNQPCLAVLMNTLSLPAFYSNFYTLNSQFLKLISKMLLCHHKLRTFFHFLPVSALEVHRALKKVDTRKAAGPDNLDTFFLTLTAYFIAESLSFIFNLCLFSNETQKMWKAAFVLSLLTHKCQ